MQHVRGFIGLSVIIVLTMMLGMLRVSWQTAALVQRGVLLHRRRMAQLRTPGRTNL
ncbi:MAG: hypothetical protein PVJ92_02855 [Candidatus Dependentiae bacterium]|jgi:hypothetical protein